VVGADAAVALEDFVARGDHAEGVFVAVEGGERSDGVVGVGSATIMNDAMGPLHANGARAARLPASRCRAPRSRRRSRQERFHAPLLPPPTNSLPMSTQKCLRPSAGRPKGREFLAFKHSPTFLMSGAHLMPPSAKQAPICCKPTLMALSSPGTEKPAPFCGGMGPQPSAPKKTGEG